MLLRKLAAFLFTPLALVISGTIAQGQTVLPPLQTEAAIIDSSAKASITSESSSLNSTSESSDSFITRSSASIKTKTKEQRGSSPFSTVAFGIKVNTLGAGLEIATPLSRSFNLRAGANIFAFAHAFNVDGVTYDSDLHFRSAQLNLDWFPFHGRFHISPGVIYAKNYLTALASVPPGAPFELGDQPLINSVDDPLGGTASINLPHQIAPTIMVGFGNLIPRSGKHLSFPFEVGAAFTGRPTLDVHLTGTACTNEGCFDAATTPEVQVDLAAEISKLNNELKAIPVYPIVSIGVAYRF